LEFDGDDERVKLWREREEREVRRNLTQPLHAWLEDGKR
jgi:hypothetical protein